MKIRRMDWYFDDYIGGTFGQLTFEEHGFYIVAINIIGSNNDWVELDLKRLAHAGKTNTRTAQRLLRQLMAKGKLEVDNGKLGQQRTLREVGKGVDRLTSVLRAAHFAGIVHARRAKARNNGQTFAKLKPMRKATRAKNKDLAEPSGTYPPSTITQDHKKSVVPARDPAPDRGAPGRARSPGEELPERPALPEPPKTKARLAELAAAARAKLLKAGDS